MVGGTGRSKPNLTAAVRGVLEEAFVRPSPTEDQVAMLEAAVREGLPNYDIDELTSHHFCAGLYARELAIPKGGIIVGKRHAKQNFFLLVKGDMTVSTNNGMRRITAPFMVVTQPGDKRVGYAHEDSITMNFHANEDDCTDLVLLENRYIVPEIGYEKMKQVGEET